MYPTTPSPMSVAVMPKSMPATRPYTLMTSPPSTFDESMYSMNDQHNFNRYERGSHRNELGRNGMKRYGFATNPLSM